MNEGFRVPPTAMGAAFMFFIAAYFVMFGMGFHRTALMLPLALAWTVALFGLRPFVEADKHSALYFAFGIMAFLLFFLHETYALKGSERDFPLIVGYAGIVFSALDITSVTETAVGRFVTRIFGASLDPSEIKPRPVRREVLVFGTMALGVAGIWLFGFLITSPVFVFLWMLIGGRKPVKLSIYVGLATLVFIYGLFQVILQYELYPGIVTDWFMETYLG